MKSASATCSPAHTAPLRRPVDRARGHGLTIRCGSSSSDDPETSNGRSARYRLLGIVLVLLSGMAIAVVPTAAKLAFEAGANTLTVVVV